MSASSGSWVTAMPPSTVVMWWLKKKLKVPQVPASIYKDPTGRVIRKAGVADL